MLRSRSVVRHDSVESCCRLLSAPQQMLAPGSRVIARMQLADLAVWDRSHRPGHVSCTRIATDNGRVSHAAFQRLQSARAVHQLR